MAFSVFIREQLDAIIDEWEIFASTLLPAAGTMSPQDLRDHSRQILLAIASDMEARKSEAKRTSDSKGLAPPVGEHGTAAATHGTLRHHSGFDLVQLVAEFRAMRASVLSLWQRTPASKAAMGERATEEIARFNEAIDQALAESVQSYSAAVETSRDLFLAILGHDLRGPLSSIRLSSDLLAASEVSAVLRQGAALRIRRASDTMGRLITDLLDYTRARLGGGIPIVRAACDVGEVCGIALDMARASHPGCRFEWRPSGDLCMAADADRVHQMLGNLLGNAVQHGDPLQPICISADGGTDGVVLVVSNGGTPIPADVLPSIFEPLVQAPSDRLDADELSKTSLGLGLFIVREIVLGHGGDVSVESSAELGTRFTVRLARETVPPVAPG